MIYKIRVQNFETACNINRQQYVCICDSVLMDDINLTHCIVIETCVSHGTESRTNPDEDRLLIQLLDPEYQKNNLLTYPVHSRHEVMNIYLSIRIKKLVAVVKTQLFFFLVSIVWLVLHNLVNYCVDPNVCPCANGMQCCRWCSEKKVHGKNGHGKNVHGWKKSPFTGCRKKGPRNYTKIGPQHPVWF